MDTNPLGKLNPENYFTIGMLTTFPLFILSLTVEFVSFDNNVAQLLFSGLFLVSLGEFTSHGYRLSVENISETHQVQFKKLMRRHSIKGYVITGSGVTLVISAIALFMNLL